MQSQQKKFNISTSKRSLANGTRSLHGACKYELNKLLHAMVQCETYLLCINLITLNLFRMFVSLTILFSVHIHSVSRNFLLIYVQKEEKSKSTDTFNENSQIWNSLLNFTNLRSYSNMNEFIELKMPMNISVATNFTSVKVTKTSL